MTQMAQTLPQWHLIKQWLKSLEQLPEVDVIWLEGSLIDSRSSPSSDIDMRFGITDAAYPQLWETERTALLTGIGEYLVLERRFIRVLTQSGIIIEADAYRTSELNRLQLHEWKILFSRLPKGQPTFQKIPAKKPAEVWPDREILSVEVVHKLTNLYLLLLANAPAPLERNDLYAARFQLDDMRTELIKVMYRRLGLQYAKRYKHLSEIFPSTWLAELNKTYMSSEADPLDKAAMVTAYIELFAVLGQHLQALSEQAGGGFEPEWYNRLHQQVAMKLRQISTV
jgi:hypothetical protein